MNFSERVCICLMLNLNKQLYSKALFQNLSKLCQYVKCLLVHKKIKSIFKIKIKHKNKKFYSNVFSEKKPFNFKTASFPFKKF